ncbi:MAG: hypothetical protein ACO1OB_05615 [Archangium sp.]
MSTEETDEIRKFWSWFATVADELARNFQNRSLLDALDTQLKRLGPVRWEFGDGTLAISPDGDASVLPLTQRIVALSPRLNGWEFFAARPAKESLPKFTFNIRGKKHVVDPTRWRYVLERVSAQSFDIFVEQVGMPELEDAGRHASAVVVLDELLGEEKRLTFVRNVEAVGAFTDHQARRAAPLSKLVTHLDSLCRPAARA